MRIQTQSRTVFFHGQPITYELERKSVKNINLRVKPDGSIHASANRRVSAERVDSFVLSKGAYILDVLDRFASLEQTPVPPRQFVTGEVFSIQGQDYTLKISQGPTDAVFTDGDALLLQTRDPSDAAKRERLVIGYLESQCRDVFRAILEELFPLFQPYGAAMPALRFRDMKSRWGSCHVTKGVITLNKKLLGMPRAYGEYVMTHELCHLVHPNHSKQFYDLLATFMPDWKERRTALNRMPARWP